MRAAALLAALALQATPAGQARIAWVPNPRVRDGTWVADPSHHLSAAIVAKLNAEISALEQATGAEIAVVVVDSTSGLTPFDFALALHRGWGVGNSFGAGSAGARGGGTGRACTPSTRILRASSPAPYRQESGPNAVVD